MIQIWISLSGPEVQRPHDSGAFGRPTGDTRSKQSKEAERRKEEREFIERTGKHPDDPEAPKEETKESNKSKTEIFTVKSFENSALAQMSGSEIQNLHDQIPTDTR